MENVNKSLDINKILGAIILIIIAVLVYLNWDKIIGKLRSTTTADGTPCSTTGGSTNDGTYINGVCTATPPKEGSACIVKGLNGTIVGGVCIQNANPNPTPQSSSIKIQITNPNGARVLSVQGGKLVSLANATLIPTGTTLVVTQYITAPHTYYNTASGWVDGNDTSVVQ